MAKVKEKLTVSRRKQILEQVRREGEVRITDLSNQFNVTEVTIRNDLEFLEKKNLILRARGGAIIAERNVGMDRHILDKSRLNSNQKIAIGQLSAQLIKENETIILDSGTTTAEIARSLDSFRKLTVVTNAINIVSLLAGEENIRLIVPGGDLRNNSMSLVGPLAEKNFKNLYVDKVFLSTDGFDTRQGVFTPNIEEASLNGVMIDNAKEVILVTDSSKFSRKSLVFICGLDKIDIVITDKGILDEDRKRLEDADIDVLMADKF